MRANSKPRLGQNFLADDEAQGRIVDALGPAATGTVLEIGPGGAAITAPLAERAARLIAVELDPALASALRARFAALPSVEIVQGDILELDIGALMGAGARSLAVVGNLPYYITSPILRHLFAHEGYMSRAVLMVQREVATRMTAVPGSSDYGLLSVLCQMHAEVQLLFTLPPEAFRPPPAVHSAVVRMEFAPRWAELGVDPAGFTRFVGCCFAQKRKTLGNNLRAAGFGAAQTSEVLRACGVSGSVRAEELGPRELAGLFRAFSAP